MAPSKLVVAAVSILTVFACDPEALADLAGDEELTNKGGSCYSSTLGGWTTEDAYEKEKKRNAKRMEDDIASRLRSLPQMLRDLNLKKGDHGFTVEYDRNIIGEIKGVDFFFL